MTSPDSFVETRTSREVGWVREDLAELGLDPFWAELAPMAGAKGRGGVGRLQVGGVELVARPYRRGGAMARLLGDRYASPARALAELEVLCALRQQGVAAVAPVAALARRHGAVWRLRLCTELLQGARPLPQFMADFPGARRASVERVAGVVRGAFDAGLRHPDLHVDNILCSQASGEVQATLVDLDRSRLAPPLSDRSRDEMLARMQRYIRKHRASLPAAPTRAETMRFLRGLGFDRRARQRLWRRLSASRRR